MRRARGGTRYGQYEPTEASPPGATLAALLEERGISQAQLAERMGLAVERVHALIEGRAAIGRDVAVGLERALGVSVEFWMARERRWREWITGR